MATSTRSGSPTFGASSRQECRGGFRGKPSGRGIIIITIIIVNITTIITINNMIINIIIVTIITFIITIIIIIVIIITIIITIIMIRSIGGCRPRSRLVRLEPWGHQCRQRGRGCEP